MIDQFGIAAAALLGVRYLYRHYITALYHIIEGVVRG